jgi:hypothetical protein
MSAEITTTTVARIQTLAAELETLGKTALAKAIEAGNLLRECKAGLAHGDWLPWLASNFHFSDRTARRWMKIAEAKDSGLLKMDTVSNLAEAYKSTAAARESRPAACPFDLPMPGQKLALALTGHGPSHYATIEAMGETYVQVTWAENGLDGEITAFEGTKRGIHRDHAWCFLTHNSSPRDNWQNAAAGYFRQSYPPDTTTTRNRNLYSDAVDWLDDCFQVEATIEAARREMAR